MGNSVPSDQLPLLKVDHPKVLVILVHIRHEDEREPIPDGHKHPNLLVHVDAPEDVAGPSAHGHDVRVSDRRRVEERCLHDEGHGAVPVVHPGGEERVVEQLAVGDERDGEVRLLELGSKVEALLVRPGEAVDTGLGHGEHVVLRGRVGGGELGGHVEDGDHELGLRIDGAEELAEAEAPELDPEVGRPRDEQIALLKVGINKGFLR